MLSHILRFEWRYHTRHLTFAAAAAIFALMGFFFAATGYGPPDVHVNSPYSVTQAVGLLSLGSVFALTLFCAQSLLRDSEHQMAEIVYTTRITKARYLFGRFAGSLAAAWAAFAFAPAGMAAGAVLVSHDPSRLGPFHAFDYLWAYAVVAVPNMLFAGALLFAVAALTRSALATYVGGVALYVLYLAAAAFTNSPLMAASSPPTPEGLAAAALADPFGLSAFFEQTHYWTAAERNVRQLALAGSFAANRLLWTGVSVTVLGLVYRLFAFRVDRSPPFSKKKSSPQSPPFSKEGKQDVSPPVLPFKKGGLGGISPGEGEVFRGWTTLWSATRLELRLTLKSWPFAALLVMWVGVVGIELLQNFRSAEFGTALLPATGLVLGRLREPLALFGLIAVVYFSAELVWRERTARADQIADVLPVGSGVFFASKLAALATLVGVLTAVAAAVAMVFQLANGYTDLEPALYASQLYFVGLPVALVAVLALLVQTLVPNRHVGMLATLAAVVVLHKGGLGGPELLSLFAFPSVGYRRGYELTDPDERRRRGLPESSRPATIEGAVAAGLGDDPGRITFAATVSTSADQIAVAPGALLRTWEEDGRRFFRYALDQPVQPFFAYASARYAVERVRHGGVDLEVYYHPRHDANVDRVMNAATRSLDYCAARFGPYPHSFLRLIEIPSYWEAFSGLAMPGVVFLVEDHAFLTDLRASGRVDVVTKRVAHEVAHQWWGHQLVPADEPGAAALVESLARYTELMVLKDLYGEAALRPVLEVELDRYLSGRTRGGEVPLYQVKDQGYLYYSKGALVMMALHDLVGEEAVNRALRGLLAKAAGTPTSLDLLEEIYRVTPEDRRSLVDQWWKQVVVYDLRVESASYEPLADGRYRVTARLTAAKSAVDGAAERPLAMDEDLDVAVYSEHPNAGGTVLYTGRHRVGGTAEITVTVDTPPLYVAIDPFLRRIDRNRADNVRKVDGQVAASDRYTRPVGTPVSRR